MKKTYLLLLFFFLYGVASAQIINFPDSMLKTKLLSASPDNYVAENAAGIAITIDTNGDNEIEVSEALAVAELYVSVASISDATGLNSFANLKILVCNGNALETLDVSGMPLLVMLQCINNQLTALDVSNKMQLDLLYCYDNELFSLNLSGCSNLRSLYCYNNNLPSLQLAGLNELRTLRCEFNELTSLEVNSLLNLRNLECYNNQLTSLQVNLLYNLESLYCYRNQLTSLNLDGLSNLVFMSCIENQLTSLSLGGLTNLVDLGCRDNLLTSLDVSELVSLWNLNAYNNRITALDCSNLSNLTYLYCFNNRLTSLNIKNGAIETTVQFSGNPNLELICTDTAQLNAISDAAFVNGNINCTISDSCSLSAIGFETGALSLYPNPVINELHIESKTPIESIHIYNLLGQMVLSVASVNMVDVSMLQPGTYLMRAYADSRTSTSKFIKL